MTTRINITSDWTITDGPSREELFDALRLFNEHRSVEFQVGLSPVASSLVRVKMQINSIAAEDGTGRNWNLIVYPTGQSNLSIDHPGPYKLYYNDNLRRGHVVDATPLSEQVRVHGGFIYRGGEKIGEVPKTI